MSMALKLKLACPYPSVSTRPSSPFPRFKSTSRIGLFSEHLRNIKAVKSCQQKHRKLIVNEKLLKRQCILYATSEGQESQQNMELDDSSLEPQDFSEDDASSVVSERHIGGGQGKAGFISFYGPAARRKAQIPVPAGPKKDKDYVLWFVGPTILVVSFIFPSLYLRRILSTVFEDSLLTDFLILFFTEAVFYFGVAVFLLLFDRQWRPMRPITEGTSQTLSPHLGIRITSGAILLLSLIVPTVTMGFVWPWTGPAASATLAPYLVGIVVQFVYEQYARRIGSPSLSAIPIVFQVYRLHQLNRAAQLVSALSFTVRGAEMTSHNMAINSSLITLLNVLHFLGVMCIWSLSSFIMRQFSSAGSPTQQDAR